MWYLQCDLGSSAFKQWIDISNKRTWCQQGMENHKEWTHIFKQPDYIASHALIIKEWWIGNTLEETDCVWSEVLCRICLEGLKKITQRLSRESPCPEGLPNSSREPYYNTSLFGLFLSWVNFIICCTELYKLNAMFYLPIHLSDICLTITSNKALYQHNLIYLSKQTLSHCVEGPISLF